MVADEKNNQGIPPEVWERFANLPKEPFERGGILTGRPFIETTFKGKRARAVGSTLYMRPENETFHEFLLWYLIHRLTPEWFQQESKKSLGLQHPVAQWMNETNQKLRESLGDKNPEGLYSVEMTGVMKKLIALGYDFYSLAHCQADVLPKLMSRLKTADQFQGAHYEVSVAGLAARSGFNIDWVNEKAKHCEFIGTHKVTKEKVAFEAKSHHREGVLARPGKFDPEEVKTKIVDHLHEAINQAPNGIPFVLFDDLNLPLTPGTKANEIKWLKGVDQELQNYGFFDKYIKTNFSALFITNFSWHLHENLPSGDNEVLTIFRQGDHMSLRVQTLGFLLESAKQYGVVPPRLEERVNKETEI